MAWLTRQGISLSIVHESYLLSPAPLKNVTSLRVFASSPENVTFSTHMHAWVISGGITGYTSLYPLVICHLTKDFSVGLTMRGSKIGLTAELASRIFMKLIPLPASIHGMLPLVDHLPRNGSPALKTRWQKDAK